MLCYVWFPTVTNRQCPAECIWLSTVVKRSKDSHAEPGGSAVEPLYLCIAGLVTALHPCVYQQCYRLLCFLENELHLSGLQAVPSHIMPCAIPAHLTCRRGKVYVWKLAYACGRRLQSTTGSFQSPPLVTSFGSTCATCTEPLRNLALKFALPLSLDE